MLFEANENPKVIQALLGHKDVRTTITVYNSVDKDYIRKSTEKFNEQFKVENPKYLNQQTELPPKQEQPTNLIENEEFSDYSEEELDEMMRKLERAKKTQRKRLRNVNIYKNQRKNDTNNSLYENRVL